MSMTDSERKRRDNLLARERIRRWRENNPEKAAEARERDRIPARERVRKWRAAKKQQA
jgi:hypothetical protein